MPSEEDRTMATGKMHKNLVKYNGAVFEYATEHTHTDKQTDILITILHNPITAK